MLPTNNREISPAELEARLRLHRLPELGPRGFRKLIEAFGSASKAISAPASAWRTLGLKAAREPLKKTSRIWSNIPIQFFELPDEADILRRC